MTLRRWCGGGAWVSHDLVAIFPGARNERYAGTVGKMYVAGRIEQREVCPGADRQAADVVALQ